MVFYFVQRGETLYHIAKRYQTTVHAIVAANRLEDPNAICAGQALVIPKPGEVPSPPPGGIVHLVRPGETVFYLARKFDTNPQEILKANQIVHPEFILPGQQLVIPERTEATDDWPMLGRTAGRTAVSPVTLEGRLAEAWTFAPRRAGAIAPSSPVIRYDRIFVGQSDGAYYALDKNTGKVRWRYLPGEKRATAPLPPTPDGRPLATPAAFDGIVYLGGSDGTVYAVDALEGRTIWRFSTGGPITSSPAVAGGLVYLGSWDGMVYALELKTGALVWRAPAGGPVADPVAVGDAVVFARAVDGPLLALDGQSGEQAWEQADVPAGAPLFAELVVVVGDRAFDPTSGGLLWRAEAPLASAVVRLDMVIYPDRAVDLFTGTPRWLAAADGAAQVVQIACGAQVLAVQAGELVARDVATGQVQWHQSLGAGTALPPAVAPGLLALVLEDGRLRAYRTTPERGRRGG